jgi:outer membrane murein-binding lipoprotein Lpp
MKVAVHFIRLLGVCVCPILVGCKDLQLTKTQAERNEIQAKISSLTSQSNELNQQIQTFRQVVPPGLASAAAANQQADKLAKELSLQEQELLKVIKSYEATDAALKAQQQELESLRSSQ